MASVNEAYRVVSDPARRYEYDRSLVADPAISIDLTDEPDQELFDATALTRPTRLAPAGPARVPWRMMAIAAVVGSALVLLASAFDQPPSKEVPDGILRPGSCVTFEPNNDVREVACGGPDDVVIEVLVPLDATCPDGTVGHRDRLGLGVACIPIDRS